MTWFRRTCFVSLVAASLALAGSSWATDVKIPGKLVLIKDGKLAKLVAKPVSPAVFPIPIAGGAADPRTHTTQARFFDTARNGSVTDGLTGASWQGLGNPAGSKGYKYTNTGAPGTGAVKVVILKPKVIKIIAVDDGSIDGPACGNIGIDLTTGSDKYCAEFGGVEVKNETGLVKRKDAAAPGACPTPGVAPTCSTCCGNAGFLSITGNAGVGDCGDVIRNSGVLAKNIACGGLYVGGGGNSVPLPITLPDTGSTVMALTSCAGNVASVGAATSTQTGSLRNCSGIGCLFGAPMPVPQPASPPTSVCTIITVTTPITGTVDCATGALNLTTSLNKEVFLTGDTATDPGGTIPGMQPCPLCSAGTCIGGPNNGMACTPGTGPLTTSYPTSHDCPPAPSASVANVTLLFPAAVASTGTISWTGTVATNDSGATESVQNRVFCGFCRDTNGTGAFDASAAPGFQFQPCWQNNMAIGTACSEALNSAESCEQRTNAAFGPNGGLNNTVTVNGAPAGSLNDLGSHAGTLASVFCVPPSFDSTIDGASDLPGPGALAMPSSLKLCSAANSCP